MMLPTVRARQLVRSALLAAVCAGAFSGSVFASSCTPGVVIADTGFTLGCAGPSLWSVLAINKEAPASGTTLEFKAGTSTLGSTNGTYVGSYGGTVKTNATSTFGGDILVTGGNGTAPNPPATNTTGVSVVSGPAPYELTGSPTEYLVKGDPSTNPMVNNLLAAARADALDSVNKIATYLAGVSSSRVQNFTSDINTNTTIYAKTSGLNVIKIGNGTDRNIDLDNGEILNFSNYCPTCNGGTGAYLDVQFLVEVTGNLKLNHQSKITVTASGGANPFGLDATDLLFNIEGLNGQSDGTLTLENRSVMSGIVFDVGGSGNDLIKSGSVLYGSLVGGGNITLDGCQNDSTGTSVCASVKNKHAPYGCDVDSQGVLTCQIFTAPEPGTIALLALGFLGIAGARMRRRKLPAPVRG